MNRKGQTLILFVILVPIIVLFMAIVIDTGLALQEKTKLNSTIKTILKTTFLRKENPEYEMEIKNLFEKNQIPTEKLSIQLKEKEIKIQNMYEIESVFGKIIGIKSYKIKSSFTAREENQKIVIVKE